MGSYKRGYKWVTLLICQLRGLIAAVIANHEPPRRVWGLGIGVGHLQFSHFLKLLGGLGLRVALAI